MPALKIAPSRRPRAAFPESATSTWRASGLSVGHDPHAEEDEPEAQHRLPDALDEPAPAEEGEREARPDHDERHVLDLEGQELHGEGRADVRAQDHAERLAEADEARRDEADQHEGGRRGGLDQRRRERPRADGGQPRPRGAHQQVPQAPARRALEPLAAELHAVEQECQSPEERQQQHG
jgi:hypothetical protein